MLVWVRVVYSIFSYWDHHYVIRTYKWKAPRNFVGMVSQKSSINRTYTLVNTDKNEMGFIIGVLTNVRKALPLL